MKKETTIQQTQENIEYSVCKAHNNMQNCRVKDGTKDQVIRFLKRQKIPFDYDVKSSHWDGTYLETSFHVTGEEFLKDSDQLDYVINHGSLKTETNEKV